MTTNKPFPLHKHELVTAIVDNVGKLTFNFKTVEYLKDKPIVGIAYHANSYLTADPQNNALVATAIAIAKGFLTLKTTKGVETINKVPLYALACGVTPGGTYEKVLPLDKLNIDFEQSYVTLAVGTGLVLNTSFLFSVWYEDGEACEPKK